MAELINQCEHGLEPRGHVIPSSFHILHSLDASVLDEPLPMSRR
jgi:hypothetical protein